MVNWWTKRRAKRRRRRGDARAVRAEFELDRRRGFAGLRGFYRQMGELEQARVAAHSRAVAEARARHAAPERATSRR